MTQASTLFAFIACLSLHQSVCPSHVGVVPKWLNSGSRTRRRCIIAQGLWFYDAKDLYEIAMGSSPTGARNAGGVGKTCVLRPAKKSPAQNALTPKICVHTPRWSASTMVRWQSNTLCHQQYWWKSTLVDYSYG